MATCKLPSPSLEALFEYTSGCTCGVQAATEFTSASGPVYFVDLMHQHTFFVDGLAKVTLMHAPVKDGGITAKHLQCRTRTYDVLSFSKCSTFCPCCKSCVHRSKGIRSHACSSSRWRSKYEIFNIASFSYGVEGKSALVANGVKILLFTSYIQLWSTRAERHASCSKQDRLHCQDHTVARQLACSRQHLIRLWPEYQYGWHTVSLPVASAVEVGRALTLHDVVRPHSSDFVSRRDYYGIQHYRLMSTSRRS